MRDHDHETDSALALTSNTANGVKAIKHREDRALLGLPSGIGHHPTDDDRVSAPHEREAVVTPQGESGISGVLEIGRVEKSRTEQDGSHHGREDGALGAEALGEV